MWFRLILIEAACKHNLFCILDRIKSFIIRFSPFWRVVISGREHNCYAKLATAHATTYLMAYVMADVFHDQ